MSRPPKDLFPGVVFSLVFAAIGLGLLAGGAWYEWRWPHMAGPIFAESWGIGILFFGLCAAAVAWVFGPRSEG